MTRRILLLLALLLPGWAGLAWAEGTQYNGTCASIAWNANTEPDLVGYRLYDRTSTASPKNLIKTFGLQITSATCASLGLNSGQHYFSLTAYDTSGNEGQSTAEVPFVIVPASVNTVSDFRVTIVNTTDMTVAFTEVDDGTGAPAKYDVRFATPTITWGTAASVTSGTCSSAVAGTTIGATKTCTITGLSTTTAYQYQLVPYRGTLGSTAVFGPLSNITGATTGGSAPVASGHTLIVEDLFTRTDGADLGADWTPVNGTWSIVSNAIRTTGAGAGFGTEVHSAVLPDDQWAATTIKTITGSADMWVGVTLRSLETEHTSYQCLAARGTGLGSDISKRINGASTTLITEASSTWAATDVLYCEARGAWITMYKNGVQVLTVEDSSLTSGKAGVWGYIGATVANMELDSFSAGGFTAVSTDTCGCDNN